MSSQQQRPSTPSSARLAKSPTERKERDGALRKHRSDDRLPLKRASCHTISTQRKTQVIKRAMSDKSVLPSYLETAHVSVADLWYSGKAAYTKKAHLPKLDTSKLDAETLKASRFDASGELSPSESENQVYNQSLLFRSMNSNQKALDKRVFSVLALEKHILRVSKTM